MATDEPIGLKLSSALCEHRTDHATKFGQDRFIRLGSRAGRNKQTNKPTDGNRENKADLGPSIFRQIVRIGASDRQIGHQTSDGPVTQQVG